jgi:hypothetical protein
MRHPKPPTDQADSVAALIEGLSPDRRSEFVAAAAQNRMIDLIDAHQKATIEDFFRAVQADQYWPLLKKLVVSDVISPSSEPDQAAPRSAPPKTGRAEDRQMPLALVPVTPAAPEPTPAGAPKRSGDILDEIVMLLLGNPGLRSEEILRHLRHPPVLVKSALAALRKAGRVRTEGQARATRYFSSTSG